MVPNEAATPSAGRRPSPAKVALGLALVVAVLFGGTALFSRAARGTWAIAGPANRIDLANGRRYYLDNDESPRPIASPDLSSFVTTAPAVWPDREWCVASGDYPIAVVARTWDGSYWTYTLSGGW